MRASRFCSTMVFSCVDRLGGPVVALHQLLARQPVRAVVQPELPGERRLEVEQQPVFAPARTVVQADAQRLQELLVLAGSRAPRRR